MLGVRRAGDRFWEEVKIIDGPHTRAIIQRAKDEDKPGDQFLAPKLSIRVKPDSLVTSGQVLLLKSGDHYLVGDHNATTEWRTHHLFKCDRQVTWLRPATTTDALTGLPKSSTNTTMGHPWVYWERVARNQYDNQTKFDLITYLVACGGDVQLNDTLDGHQVFRFDRSLGLNILGLRQ